MVINFVIAEAADIPDRLRFRGWFASAIRFTRQVLDSVRSLIKTRLQPRSDSPDPETDLSVLIKKPDFSLDHTTDLKLLHPDWYLFFSISPPRSLQGICHDQN
ncbi:hypothetical protein ACQ4N7_16120 [Nodosilinea sp. AN01ver1]|uniref:hypothetical protein n=1 Tax=Nodosilinea sp. AN01ver1 TaxID=3423362 RepID=UPI003D31CC8A